MIPKELRERAGLQPGSEVDFALEGDHVVLAARRQRPLRWHRDHGRAAADETLAELRAVVELELPGIGRMVETARLKSDLAIALGDCFAIATAAAHDVALLTGDPEIIESDQLPCAVEDLRRARP